MRRYKLLLNFSDCLVRPTRVTRLIIFVHRFCRLVIGQYFESAILFTYPRIEPISRAKVTGLKLFRHALAVT